MNCEPFTPHPRYSRQCKLEDLLAHLYDAQLTVEVLLALNRGNSSAQKLCNLVTLERQQGSNREKLRLLYRLRLELKSCNQQTAAELKRLRRQLDILKKYISAEWHTENGSEPEEMQE